MVLTRAGTFQGTSEECVLATLGDAARVEEVSLLEHRVDWDRDGFSGYATNVSLRSGLELVISESRSAGFHRFPVDGTPTPLQFILSRGSGVPITINGSLSYLSGGGFLEVSLVRRPIEIISSLPPDSCNEFVVLKANPELMCELLDVTTMPRLVTGVVNSEKPFARAAVPMDGELFRLLDALLHFAAEGKARQLYLEAKALEVLARVYEALDTDKETEPNALPPKDVARVHRVRNVLLKQIDATPTLEELSREAGVNRTKLKEDFRHVFGLPIYSYLRERRMSEAHKLLGIGDLNVTEVASRVGYSNASKFSLAFRKHFGFAPSEARASRLRSSQRQNG